jgi:proteic killer suppression protein
VIRSFRCNETERLFNRLPSRRWRNIERVIRRKLELLNAATSLMDLTVPPNNRLEALRGNRRGQHSIRVNDQWRVCFVWRDGDAHEVEVVDYH